MNEEFKNVKVKAGNIDKDGIINVKVNTEGGSESGIATISIPDSFAQKYLLNPACYNKATSITDEEDVAVCKEIAKALFDSENAPIRIEFTGNTYYPEIYLNIKNKDYTVSILSAWTHPQLGTVLESFKLNCYNYDSANEEYVLDLYIFELTQKSLG